MGEGAHDKEGDWFFWFNHALFLLTSLGANLVANELDYQGAGETRTCLINTSTYVGQVAFCFLYDPHVFSKIKWKNLWKIRHLCVFELLGSISYQLGLYYIGSGLHILIYSFITVYCALANLLLYKKRLTPFQWAAILLVTAFIVVSGLGQLELPDTDAWSQTLGMACSLTSVIMFGSVYVFTNAVMDRQDAPSEGMLGMMVGVSILGVLGVYELLHVLPNWQKMVVEPILHENKGATMVEILGMYAFLTLMNGLHQLSFYLIMSLGPSSAISGSINKALTAVILFFLADRMFCFKIPSTCLNIYKVMGAVGVVCSILLYAYVTPKSLRKKELESGQERYEEPGEDTTLLRKRRKSQAPGSQTRSQTPSEALADTSYL